MTLSKAGIIGSLSLIITVAYPHNVWAKNFKNKDFLKMAPIQQKFWLSGAIDTLGHVAVLKNKTQSQCTYDWYYGDTANQNGIIMASIRKYPDHTPSAIVIVLAEKKCGKFVRPSRQKSERE